MELAEQYFYALAAMRKPAAFVRYWGEGHGNSSPANVIDRFVRVLAWYDQWGDVARDRKGELLFDGDHVKGRNGAPGWTAEDFIKSGPIAAATPVGKANVSSR